MNSFNVPTANCPLPTANFFPTTSNLERLNLELFQRSDRQLPTANRINYRNHRKIIVIDGRTAFVGGINVSDKYINDSRHPEKTYWRDTHLRIDSPVRKFDSV